MNKVPTATQIQMPTLTKVNNGTRQYSNLDTKRQNKYVEKTSPLNGIKPALDINLATNPTTKVAIDGKVVGIDVLTKLQQQNVGNIVSFTASKEFISNLTNSKFTLNKKNNVATSCKQMEPSVFRMNKNNELGIHKANQEKLLLPKTQANGLVAKRNSSVEIKKFVPEMKGLLSGLSTALKTSAATTNSPVQSFHLLKKSTLLPVGTNTLSSGKGSVLIAVKTTSRTLMNTSKPPLKSIASISTNSGKALPAISSFKTTVPVRTIRPVLQIQSKPNFHPQYTQQQTRDVNNASKPTSTTTNVHKQPTSIVGTSKNTSYLKKASSVSASIDSGRIHLFRQNNQFKANHIKDTNTTTKTKVINPSSTLAQAPKLADSLLQIKDKTQSSQMMTVDYARQKLNKTKLNQELKTSGSKDGITGFNELYEKAVQNVLNIKAFPDDLSEEVSTATKELEKKYQKYLEMPVLFDSNIKKHLTLNCNETDEPKKKASKLESLPQSPIFNTEHVPSTRTFHKNKHEFEWFDFKNLVRNENSISSSRTVDADNLKFFSQFLNDQAKPNQDISRAFYKPTDFPWMHGPYVYEQYYRMPYFFYGGKECMKENDNQDDSKNEKKELSIPETSRMKLNTVKKKGSLKKEEEAMIKLSPDEEVKKINKGRKTCEKQKNNSRSSSSQDKNKKLKAKEVQKFKRYTLRQRALVLKKAKKLALERPPEPAKYVLKELNGKSVTKKEFFLGYLGLRRILKRLDKKAK